MADMVMKHPNVTSSFSQHEELSYLNYGDKWAFIWIHIALMSIAWPFVLPIFAMLHCSDSRYHPAALRTFVFLNLVAAIFGAIYRNTTPDLYNNSIHERCGWFLVIINSIHAMLRQIIGAKTSRKPLEPLHTLTDDSTDELLNGTNTYHEDRNDHSVETSATKRLAIKIDLYFRALLSKTCLFWILFVIGISQMLSGVVTLSHIFVANQLGNGLAHFIKGGIFVLWGVISWARYLGGFESWGWSWNGSFDDSVIIRTTKSQKHPTAEYVECWLIFVYGITNVFLEHLSAWGGAWTANDFEHTGIAFMFIGFGLCGLLMESPTFMESLSRNHTNNYEEFEVNSSSNVGAPTKLKSVNPFPSILIFVLGLVMSLGQHHQASSLSMAMHSQWGSLLSAFSVARFCTYLRMDSPQKSYVTARPVTEIVASFCLCCGGLIFMASNRDTVAAIEALDITPGVVFISGVGVTALALAWEMILFGLRGYSK